MPKYLAIGCAAVLSACSVAAPPNPGAGQGFVSISLALVPSDVVSLVATVTAPDIATPITATLTISGNPASATGVINNVPAGEQRTVTLQAFPAAPEDSIVIYQGVATTAVQAGQQSSVNLVLNPVYANVSVTASFPSGDTDIGEVSYVAVVVSGARVSSTATYYLALNASAGTATGVIPSIPVGLDRTFAVTASNASGSTIFSGSGTADVLVGNDSVEVALTNQTGEGSIAIDGGFCNPNCAGMVCGSDGCGGTCGDCMPGVTCVSGQCETASGPPNWVSFAPTTQPPARYSQMMAYDSVRGVTVMFGGLGNSGALADTWEWDGSNWTQMSPATAPPRRHASAMVYDSTHQKMVLFGGCGSDSQSCSTFLNDTWEWDGSNWSNVTPATSPQIRNDLWMTFDSARGVTVMFGGMTPGTAFLNETWEFNGSTWTQANPATVPPVLTSFGADSMTFDTNRNVSVILGGCGAGSASCPSNQTWEWDGSNWSERFPASGPSSRFSAAMSFDSTVNASVLFGGCSGGPCSTPFGETWQWDGTAWTQQSPMTSPPARWDAVMSCGVDNGSCVLFGGLNGSQTILSDTWEYSSH